MSTIHQITEQTLDEIKDNSNVKNVASVKGAPKEVLNLCTHIHEDGKEEPMSETMREQIMMANDSYAREGLRVLAVAMRVLPKDGQFTENLNEYTPELVERFDILRINFARVAP